MSRITALNISKLSKSYGSTQALDDASLTINAGEVVALLGENGAGKTTLIQQVLGQLKADSGEIAIFGHQPGSRQAKQLLGTVLQSTDLPDTLTVKEHIELFSSYYANPLSVDETLQRTQLTEFAHRKLTTLSGGQKQRVFFALAICGQPKLILLDEPTVGLDVNARRDFWQCLRDLVATGTTLLLTTHYLEEADALADRIVLLSQGKILHDGTSESIKACLGGKRIRFKSMAKPSDIQSALPDAETQYYGGYVEIISAEPENTLQQLFRQSIDMSDLTVSQISLEDAFIQLSFESQEQAA